MLKLVTHPNEILDRPMPDFDFDNPVTDPRMLEEEMVKLMYQENGIGLAAPQVGIEARVFTIYTRNLQGVTEPFAVFNPKIIAKSDDMEMNEEGCLSFPGEHCIIRRPDWIDVRYQDWQGDWHSERFSGILARCFQHELDHLDGVTMWHRQKEQHAEQSRN